jgi:hypothetical protein
VTHDLPQHVATDEWQKWPRKVDAHLAYGVRERQVTAHVRAGKLKAYGCPDGVVRLDPEACAELYGPPGVISGRERDLSAVDRKRKRELEMDPDDPVASMFRAAVTMMHDMHRESVGVLKIITEPLNTLLVAYKETIASQHERIKVLEAHVDEALVLRSELADATQERELKIKRHAASEKRRDETMTLLKEQLPKLATLYVEGESLSAFARRAPRDAIEALIDSGALSESDTELLRRVVPARPQPQTTNGMQS